MTRGSRKAWKAPIIAAGMSDPLLSTIVVAHDSLQDLRTTLPALHAQLNVGDEVIVVDSGSSDGLASELERITPSARLIPAGGNVGFAAGANLGAGAAQGDLIVLLNPDAVVQPGWADAMRAPWGGPWAGWMALVTMNEATAINTSAGVLHFTGFAWAGQVGDPVSAAPPSPAEVGFLSGACLALPRAAWQDVGGFPAEFFMYCEDVDLSLKLRLRGGRLAVVPDAKVVHDYEFLKDLRKWRLLERNRWATVLRTYPASLLVLVFPALIATDIVVWATAVRGGWARMKALATLDIIRWLPRLARERRVIQAVRVVDAATFASAFTDELSSPYFGALGRNHVVRKLLALYWALVRFLLLAAPAGTS